MPEYNCWGWARRYQNVVLFTAMSAVIQESHELEPEQDTGIAHMLQGGGAVKVCVMSEHNYLLCLEVFCSRCCGSVICIVFIRMLLYLLQCTVCVCWQRINCSTRWLASGSDAARTFAESWNEQIKCSSAIMCTNLTLPPLPSDLLIFLFSRSLRWLRGLFELRNC